MRVHLASLVGSLFELLPLPLLLVVPSDVFVSSLLRYLVTFLLIKLLLLDEFDHVLLHLLLILSLLGLLSPDLLLQALGLCFGYTAFLLHLFLIKLW